LYNSKYHLEKIKPHRQQIYLGGTVSAAFEAGTLSGSGIETFQHQSMDKQSPFYHRLNTLPQLLDSAINLLECKKDHQRFKYTHGTCSFEHYLRNILTTSSRTYAVLALLQPKVIECALAHFLLNDSINLLESFPNLFENLIDVATNNIPAWSIIIDILPYEANKLAVRVTHIKKQTVNPLTVRDNRYHFTWTWQLVITMMFEIVPGESGYRQLDIYSCRARINSIEYASQSPNPKLHQALMNTARLFDLTTTPLTNIDSNSIASSSNH